MLLPATTTPATTITADSSPAFIVRRPYIPSLLSSTSSPPLTCWFPPTLLRISTRPQVSLSLRDRCPLFSPHRSSPSQPVPFTLLRPSPVSVCVVSSPSFPHRQPMLLRKHRLQNHLYASNVTERNRRAFPTMQSTRYLITTKASRDRGGAREPNGSSSGENARPRPSYHPSEDIEHGPASVGEGEGDGDTFKDRSLTLAEKSRTIVEVNDKATVIFSESIDDEIDTRVLWPQVSYITDEHGGIFIEVGNEEEMLETITENDNLVQVFIGVDNVEKISEMEISEPSNFHLSMGDFMDEELDTDDDVEDAGISDSDDEDEGDDDDSEDYDDDDYDDFSSESFVDWTNLETMRHSHPVYFARRIAEAVSNIEVDWMNQPSPILVIQGFLRPAFVEDQSDEIQLEKNAAGETDSNGGSYKRSIFYKLEIITMQLASGYGNVSVVKVEDYPHAQPDGIAHSAARIISRLKSGGEKTAHALKSLCLRCKGIQVEEVCLTSVDSLGFDLRACSGTQIQNLRFSFETQATSEYGAERQLNDLLFPRIQTKKKVKKQRPPQGNLN